MIERVEALIVGAGVVGSSVAMHLAEMGMSGIRVIDFDLEGSLSSSELNAGGVRATWFHPINIQMSKLSIEYFSRVAEQVGYRPCGYLWLHSPEKFEAALKAQKIQASLGWPVEVWDVPHLQRQVPFLDRTEGIAGALFGPQDGLINPNLLKNHFRAEGKARGVRYDDRTLLTEVRYSRDESRGIEVGAERYGSSFSPESRLKVAVGNSGSVQEKTRVRYQAKYLVNCAGPWASSVAKILGYVSPCFPVRRQVCIFDCKEVDLTPYGMIVDTSGVYFHPEASHGLAGVATPNEPQGINYAYDGEQIFTDVIWPALYERSSSFEKLKHVTGWAGQYEVSPDECAVLGQVVTGDPKYSGHIFEAHSFSGHGVMQSYSAGKALAEKIVFGRFETLDAEELSANRFETGRLLREGLII